MTKYIKSKGWTVGYHKYDEIIKGDDNRLRSTFSAHDNKFTRFKLDFEHEIVIERYLGWTIKEGIALTEIKYK